MKHEDVIALAMEAGFSTKLGAVWVDHWEVTRLIERFAALVAAAERKEPRMKTSFTIERRKNYNGVWCIAPSINGFNVWDIPDIQWTPAVARSVQRAYEIGYAEALRRVQELRLPSGGEWEEVR